MKKQRGYLRYIVAIIIGVLVITGITESRMWTAEAATAQAKKKKTPVKKKTTSKKKSGTTNGRKKTARKKNTRTKAAPKEKPAPKEEVLNDGLTLLVNDKIAEWMPQNLNPGGLRVNAVKPDNSTRTATISLNENFTYLPVTADFISELKNYVGEILPDSVAGYELMFKVGDKGYSYFINTIEKLPEQYRKNTPIVKETHPLAKADKGMAGDMIAMWPSHGRYFKPGRSAWFWQRPQLFQVTEDTHTMSYIYPYVVPMIENAGGYVFLPRERDLNREEVIVDNDVNPEGEIFSQNYYKEKSGSKKWETGEEEGFIYDLPDFRDTENPFRNGTYRQTTTVTGGKESVAAWCADIPKDGEYAVYVSYKSLPNSTEDARYTVNYSGGSKEFIVNQKMGGGTWIYLGTFPLEAGFSEEEPIVSLTNMSSKEGRIVTADAVKIGGGMGNIARSDNREDIYYDYPVEIEEISADESGNGMTAEEYLLQQKILEVQKNSANSVAPTFSTSGLPRFLEGARYWLHWAGAPEDVYSPYHGTDDYKDDYTSRGLWVNWLAGGSRVLPDRTGLNIPIDVTMALHSDAGLKPDDSIIGTLGIYFTNNGDNYKDGTPRSNSRTLTDMLMRQITMDIRQTWEPNWTRRAMWDKTYVEARVPEVPTSLIEFMSHQNFGDMKYALDPNFRFTVGRAIYKAIGRFVAERKDRKFVVQPLPVKDFAIEKEKKGVYKLSWKATEDPLEPTAMPEKYIIMERTGDQLGFHKIGETSSTNFNVKINDELIHSFKIIAANDGGVSFPSEILALREVKGNQSPVLIINGFTRLSGPSNFSIGDEAGFNTEYDFGVPYKQDISFIGYQTEFRRSAGDNFGKSNGDYADAVIAGNTFDYPYLHGQSIAASGRGFVSCSVGAVENGTIKLDEFKTIDLILGKQKTTVTGNGFSGSRYQAFSKKLMDKLKPFIKDGGKLFVSGEYVVSDLLNPSSPAGSEEFAREYLGIAQSPEPRTMTGSLQIENKGAGRGLRSNYLRYSNNLNEKSYIVENPDNILPAGNAGEVFLKFSDTGGGAGVTTGSRNRNVIMTVPFEALNPDHRDELMKGIMDYLEK